MLFPSLGRVGRGGRENNVLITRFRNFFGLLWNNWHFSKTYLGSPFPADCPHRCSHAIVFTAPSYSLCPGSTALCKNAWGGSWQHCSDSSAAQTLRSAEKNTLQGTETRSSVTLPDSKFISHSANPMQRGRWVKSILSPLLIFPHQKSRVTEATELTTTTPTSRCMAQFRALFPAAFSCTLSNSCMSPRSFSSSL